jgi:hypothetical protein
VRNAVYGCLSVAYAIACVGCSCSTYPDPFTEKYDIQIPASSFQVLGDTYAVPKRSFLLYYYNGTADAIFTVAQPGVYTVHVFCAGTRGGREMPRFKVYLDGGPVGAETPLTALDPRKYVFEVTLDSGEHEFSVEYTNDFFFTDGQNDVVEDRNLILIGVGLRKVR